MFRILAIVFTLTIASDHCVAGEFSQFRGSDGTGIVADQPIPEMWSAEQNLGWKVTNPGAGWSQPIIWEDRIYVTGAVAEKDLRPSNFADGVKSPQSMGVSLFAKAPDVPIDWKLFCLSTKDGSILWEQTIVSGKPKVPIHPSNSWATESPVADENGIYVSFGAPGVVAAVDHTGKLRWTKEIGTFKTSNSFGTGSSLALHDGKVFAQNFNEDNATTFCFDTQTGDEKWKVTRTDKGTSWSTPLLWSNSQRIELIVSGGEQIDSLNPETGESLWTVKNVKASTANTPCADENRLYFGGSDPFSKGPLFAIQPGGSGELSPEKKNAQFATCQWLQERQGPGMASSVSSGKFVYTLESNILKCFGAETGERLYQQRLPGLDLVAASPLLIGNKLLLLDEKGAACLVAEGPTFEVVGSGQLPDTFWATPAVADGAIYFRGLESIYCIRSKE